MENALPKPTQNAQFKQKHSGRMLVASQRKRFYGFFPEKIKREVVQAVYSGKSVREVSNLFGICYKNIERWMHYGVQRKHSLRPKRNHQL